MVHPLVFEQVPLFFLVFYSTDIANCLFSISLNSWFYPCFSEILDKEYLRDVTLAKGPWGSDIYQLHKLCNIIYRHCITVTVLQSLYIEKYSIIFIY